MLLDEYLQDLQKITKKKPPTYERIAEVLNLGSKQAVSNRIYRKQQLKEFEIQILNSEFKKDNTGTQINENIILDYYPNIFGTVKNNAFTFATKKEQVVIPKNAFSVDFSQTSKYCVIKANNSGMEPYIYPQDKLIIKHYANEQIIDNSVYIFSYKDEIFIRRLVKNINQLILISENKEYDNVKIEKDNLTKVKIIGQVVGLMRDTL